MEDNYCVLKDTCPSNQMIAKVQRTRNGLFSLRIILDMKGKTNIGAAFKVESKEADEHFDKKENDNADFQAAFQTKVQDESWLWHLIFGHLNFGGMRLLHTKNMVKGFL